MKQNTHVVVFTNNSTFNGIETVFLMEMGQVHAIQLYYQKAMTIQNVYEAAFNKWKIHEKQNTNIHELFTN